VGGSLDAGQLGVCVGHSGHSRVNKKYPRTNSRTMNRINVVAQDRGLEIYCTDILRCPFKELLGTSRYFRAFLSLSVKLIV
jgi:hypothetical protein